MGCLEWLRAQPSNGRRHAPSPLCNRRGRVRSHTNSPAPGRRKSRRRHVVSFCAANLQRSDLVISPGARLSRHAFGAGKPFRTRSARSEIRQCGLPRHCADGGATSLPSADARNGAVARGRVAPPTSLDAVNKSPAGGELAARHLASFSSDTVADDWHHRISPRKIISLAVSRLEARGKGILLLHDIHSATVAALPGLLKDLKARGFHIVQVVASSVNQF